MRGWNDDGETKDEKSMQRAARNRQIKSEVESIKYNVCEMREEGDCRRQSADCRQQVGVESIKHEVCEM